MTPNPFFFNAMGRGSMVGTAVKCTQLPGGDFEKRFRKLWSRYGPPRNSGMQPEFRASIP